MTAARNGNASCIKAILDKARTHLGTKEEFIKFLLRGNVWNVTATHLAAFFDHPEAVELLTDEGGEAVIVAQNKMDWTPLIQGSIGGSTECVKILAKKGPPGLLMMTCRGHMPSGQAGKSCLSFRPLDVMWWEAGFWQVSCDAGPCQPLISCGKLSVPFSDM